MWWSQASAFLRWRILATVREKVVREPGKNLECSSQPGPPLTQNHLIATTKDLDFRASEAELFRQPHCLAVSRLENPRRCARCLMHTSSIYASGPHATLANLPISRTYAVSSPFHPRRRERQHDELPKQRARHRAIEKRPTRTHATSWVSKHPNGL